MTETMAYTMIGILGYFAAYLIIGCGTTAIWKTWAFYKVGMFWEYSVNLGLKRFYPGVWDFVRYHNWVYSIIYVLLWPVMVPGQMAITTKCLRRLISREYWY